MFRRPIKPVREARLGFMSKLPEGSYLQVARDFAAKGLVGNTALALTLGVKERRSSIRPIDQATVLLEACRRNKILSSTNYGTEFERLRDRVMGECLNIIEKEKKRGYIA